MGNNRYKEGHFNNKWLCANSDDEKETNEKDKSLMELFRNIYETGDDDDVRKAMN